ncbi:hypothetical protein CMV_006242 [Castanea mollissima]|uniref:Mitochondrial ATP synthase subunit G protein n=1 Tax=Castanea mollissima TaxID=60419 RepID=A0A8J4VTS3_9ROSI|nr:hypothetical protein CMV_006242 [Castanea mollissima]
MASKLHQLQSKAVQASQFVSKHGGAYYKQLLEENKQFIQEPPTVEKCNLLSKQLFYTRLASIPGRYESFWKELDYVKHLWKHRQELKWEGVLLSLVTKSEDNHCLRGLNVGMWGYEDSYASGGENIDIEVLIPFTF